MNKFLLALEIFIFLFSGCSHSENKISVPYSQLSSTWVQDSRQYPSVTKNIFDTSKEFFLENKTNGKNAIIIDIDQVILNNGPYISWLIEHNEKFSYNSWIQWYNSNEASEIPGALDFTNFIASNQGEIFYISNRPQEIYTDTLNNLNSLGFPYIDPLHIFFVKTLEHKISLINAIKDQGYKTVLSIGNTLEDIPIKKQFILPNPFHDIISL